MSDHDAAPDPIDKAYVQAEAVLSDEDARAARRARVLEAVAQEAATPPAAASPPVPRLAWRRGRWLAAASVAGLGVLVASQIYRPPPYLPQTAPAPATSAARPTVASPAPPAAALSPAPAPQTVAIAPPTFKPVQPIAPPTFTRPPPYDPASVPPPQAFPEAAAPPPPPSVVVTAERRDEAVASEKAPPLAGAVPAGGFESPAARPSDQAAKLRAAAGAGRIADVQALLNQGVPVDAPDAEGDTALMKSVLADRPAVAALLRRHGANLDYKNHAGDSARDMAPAKGDAALNQALGLAP